MTKMHDLEFLKVTKLPQWIHLTRHTYHCEGCANVAKVFELNHKRITGLALVPGHAMYDGELWENAVAKAMIELDTDDRDAKEVSERATEIFHKGWEVTNIQEKLRRFNEATSNANILWSNIGNMHGALHSILQSMVIQAWSAFEVLADHLWRAATVQKPALISAMSSGVQKSIGFRSRKKIRSSYAATFKNDNAWILNVLASQAIDSLALVRCVLVHSGGIVDEWFMNDSVNATEIDDIKALGVGNPIELTGPRTRSLIDPITEVGFELLEAVDDWLWFNK